MSKFDLCRTHTDLRSSDILDPSYIDIQDNTRRDYTGLSRFKVKYYKL